MAENLVDGYRADWNQWGSFLETSISDAVALSCDIDLEAVQGRIPRELHAEYVRRREIAMNHVTGGGLRTVTRNTHGHRVAMVRLTEFARWAAKMEWSLPVGFPKPLPDPVEKSAGPAYARHQTMATGRGRAGSWQPEDADWDTWRRVAKCELWEAVVLSLGHEPRSFVPNGGRVGNVLLAPFEVLWAPPQAALTFMRDSERLAIEGRLKVAVSNLDAPGGIVALDERHEGLVFTTTIALSQFGSWAEGKWNDLPQAFPRQKQAPKATPRTPDTRGSVSTKERTSLLVIIAALAEKSKTDLTHPTTAAKEIVTIARSLKAVISLGTVEKYLKETADALDRKAIPEED